MPKPKLMKEFEPGHGFTQQDWDEVSDNPEWTAEDFKKARPFAEVFPELAAGIKQKAVPILIDREIVTGFQNQGPDWEKRINAVLRKAVGL